ncbi:MAG: 3-hydroxylacyl-ACP dehydratase [Nitrosomonadaceae bacterium]|jgi:predicted hotdog family 3-hydroxylacyl-ACP dehydratase|nr:3-hydroxylacyl-ACP dehydratase [Nitrosomonadaceae bacterium]
MKKQIFPELIEIIPHRPPMVLLDEITEFGVDFISTSVRIHENSLFYERGSGVPIWVGLEYMAQTAAALIGVEGSQKGDDTKLGFLLGSRRYETSTSYFTLGIKIYIKVTRVFQKEELGQFQCLITDQQGQELAWAHITAFMPDDSDAFFRA